MYIHIYMHIYVMYNALCDYIGAEENYLLPYILLIYYDYADVLNTVYSLLDTGGTAFSCTA